MEKNSEYPVKLYIYDLSMGIAKMMSKSVLGKDLDGIWHTGIVVHNKEYYFSSQGICFCDIGGTILGNPSRVLELGNTQITKSLLDEYLAALAAESYRPQDYNLLHKNCNNFSNELAQFLCGKSIPDEIVNLPHHVLDSPIGPLIRPLLSQIQVSERVLGEGKSIKPETSQNNCDIPKASEVTEETKMADAEVVDGNSEETKPKKPREPPIVFKEVDPGKEFENLYKAIGVLAADQEQQSMKEMYQYTVEDEGAWALGEGTILFIGRLLHDKSILPAVRVHLLNLLASAAMKDDVILLLHQDRKDHLLMNYAADVDRLPIEEQEALSLFMCNLFEQSSSSEWLLYISEWQFNGTSLSNVRVTTKVAVNALLGETKPLQERGTAMMYNLAGKEKFKTNINIRQLLPKGSLSKVFDDVATELAMAILQFLNTTPSEEYLFRTMKALLRFTTISYNEVPALIQMIGPQPDSFRKVSDRVDDLINELNTKIAAAASRGRLN